MFSFRIQMIDFFAPAVLQGVVQALVFLLSLLIFKGFFRSGDEQVIGKIEKLEVRFRVLEKHVKEHSEDFASFRKSERRAIMVAHRNASEIDEMKKNQTPVKE